MSLNARALLTRPKVASASSAWLAAKHSTLRKADSKRSVVCRASAGSQVLSDELCRLKSPIGERWPSSDSLSSNPPGSQLSAYEPASSHQEEACSYAIVPSIPQGLSGIPYSTAGIMNAYLSGATAVAATGQLQWAGYEWVQKTLLYMLWEQTVAAEVSAAEEALRPKCSKPLTAMRKRLFEAVGGLQMAKRHLCNKAAVFGYHLLSALNNNGYREGLAFDELPLEFQKFAYCLLLKCGCISSWGLPVYRSLPASAANIIPGVIVAIPLEQYLAIAQHTPTVCRQEFDGTWEGDAQVRIDPFQVVCQQELAKALGPEMLQVLFRSSGGFAADLAAAAAKVGILDEAVAAAACSTSSTSSLAELLLLKFYRACVGMSAAALASLRTMQQQESSRSPTSAPFAVGDLDCSNCCMACATNCGGSGGSRRGSITAVGSDDFDNEDVGAATEPVCQTSSSWKNIGNVVAAARTNNNRSRLGVFSKARSFIRRFIRR